MTKSITASPRRVARIAGIIYVMVFVAGIYSLFNRSGFGVAAGMIAGVCYIAVTVLFYFIFKPVSRGLSLLAAIISLAGIVIGPVSMFLKTAAIVNPLVFSGSTVC